MNVPALIQQLRAPAHWQYLGTLADDLTQALTFGEQKIAAADRLGEACDALVLGMQTGVTSAKLIHRVNRMLDAYREIRESAC